MGHWRKNVISFLLTNQCNLDCAYCSVGRKPEVPRTLDVGFAEVALEDYFRTDPRAMGIRFFANGEPTLELALMDAITNRAVERYGTDIVVEVQTNGYFGPEVVDWLQEHATVVWISFDGLPEYHDKYRRTCAGQGTSERVVGNMLQLADHVFVGCRMTITEETVWRQAEALEFLAGIGIRNVCSDPMYDIVQPGDHELPGKPSYMDYSQGYVDALARATQLGVRYLSFLTVNFDEKVRVFCRSCLPTPHVLNDGHISCCDMAYSHTAQHMRPLIYGRYVPEERRIEYDSQKVAAIRARSVENLANCQGCPVLEHCAGGCLGEVLNETGSFNGIREDFCAAVRYLAERLGVCHGPHPFLHP